MTGTELGFLAWALVGVIVVAILLGFSGTRDKVK